MAVADLGLWLRRLRRVVERPGHPSPSDAEVLERFVRQRDEAAFELLVWRHGPAVLGLCRRLLQDTHLADDAFQATFLVLVKKAGSIVRRHSLSSWLTRLARLLGAPSPGRNSIRPGSNAIRCTCSLK